MASFYNKSHFFAGLIFANHQAGIRKFVEFIFMKTDQIGNKSWKNLSENDEYTLKV